MRAIIFGANGQDGYFLNELLVSKNIEVIRVSRNGNHTIGDVADYNFVNKLISDTKPEYVFHLAANSTTRHDVLFENYRTICDGTNNILESVRLASPLSKVFLSGSALQFENSGAPINEQTPFCATSPYAVARIQSTYAGRYYRQAFQTRIYTGFFFNHDSCLRSENHVNQKVARAVQRIAAGSEEKIELGNLEVKKEFNFAGDIVEAVWQLVNQNHLHEVVLGSGKAYSIQEWVEACFRRIGKDWREYVVSSKNAYRHEYHQLVSDPVRIFSTGWRPKVDFGAMCEMMLSCPI